MQPIAPRLAIRAEQIQGRWNLRQARLGCRCPSRSSRAGKQYLVQRDRQFADAFAGCVVDGVRYRRRDAGDADLADAVQPERRMRFGNVVLDDVDHRHVGMHRHVVLGQRRIHDATGIERAQPA